MDNKNNKNNKNIEEIRTTTQYFQSILYALADCRGFDEVTQDVFSALAEYFRITITDRLPR